MMASLLLCCHRQFFLLLLTCACLILPGTRRSGALADVRFIFSICDRSDGNYTDNSTFQVNLGSVLSSLNSSAPILGDDISVAGEGSDQVNGLAVCRGDLSPEQCMECMATATTDITEKCPNSKAATAWYDPCYVKYSSSSFFHKSTGVQVSEYNIANVTDPVSFNSALGSLLAELTLLARNSSRLFASGVKNFTSYNRLYALVQCTKDLDPDTCESCLRNEIGYIPTCCASKKGAKVIGGSCFLRYEVNPFFEVSNATNPVPDPSPPTLTPPTSSPTPAPPPTLMDSAVLRGPVITNKNTRKTVVAIVIPATTVLAAAAAVFLCICARRRNKKFRKKGWQNIMQPTECLVFDLETLKLATDNFSGSKKLGEGGFGGVFKGVLRDGKEIAVKRLSRNSGQGLGEVRNEVDLVAKLQHRNLVRLLGCCLEDEEMVLVYEYLPNTSLDKFLFDPQKSTLLSWEMRVRMIEGIARGLLYLHEDSRLKVIHRDMKASNVLLDENMNPKIADFGLARLMSEGQTLGNTNRIAGTYGYMAPEYVFHGQISRKIDVYSFGVLLLEIVTGRKCVGVHGTTGASAGGLLGYVWKHWEEGDAQAVVDPNAGDYQVKEARKCIHIGLLCVQQEPTKRPSMSSVIHMLIGDSETLPTLDVNPVLFAYLTYDHSTTTTSTTADGPPRCAPPAHGDDDITMSPAR